MIWLITLPFFVFLSTELFFNYYATNTALFKFINSTPIGSPFMWENITFLGDGLPAFVLLILFSRKYPKILWQGVVIAIITGFSAQIIKHIVHTLRPAKVLGIDNIHVIGQVLNNSSFPSGHSVTAFALAALLFFNFKKYKLTLILLASSIAWSRVVVGAHWPTDVIAGAILGWYGTKFSLEMSKQWNWGTESKSGELSIHILSLCAAIALWPYGNHYPHAILFAHTLSVIATIIQLRQLNNRYSLSAWLTSKIKPLNTNRSIKHATDQ